MFEKISNPNPTKIPHKLKNNDHIPAALIQNVYKTISDISAVSCVKKSHEILGHVQLTFYKKKP